MKVVKECLWDTRWHFSKIKREENSLSWEENESRRKGFQQEEKWKIFRNRMTVSWVKYERNDGGPNTMFNRNPVK